MNITPNPTILSQIAQKLIIISIVSVLVLSAAASCSFNPFGIGGNKQAAGFYGVLKQDPKIKKDGFGKINSVKTINSKVDTSGLEGLSVLKMEQISKDILFVLTKEKGVFRTGDSGKNWQRIYIFSVTYTEDKEKQKQLEADLKKNDQVSVTDFWVDQANPTLIYMSANYDKKGKIYKTTDSGKSVKEVYSEINAETSVDFVVSNSNSPDKVYALLNKNALILSNDGGKTWQKVNDYSKEKDRIVQIGFLPDSETFFILYEKIGLATSVDGLKWVKQSVIKKEPEPVPAEEPKIEPKEPQKEQSANDPKKAVSPFSISNAKDKIMNSKIVKSLLPPFKIYQKLIPIGADLEGKKPAILIADKQIWITDDVVTSQFVQINNVPVQDDKVAFEDVAVDPFVGPQKIYVAIGSKLLVSENGGESWSNKNLGVEGNASISKIILDKAEQDVIYLGLANIQPKK